MLTYVLRSLKGRLGAVLPTGGAIAIGVAVTCALLAGVLSFRRALLESGSPDNATILMASAQFDSESHINERETIERFKVLPAIKKLGDRPMLSPEKSDALRILRRDGGLDYLYIRGVEPIAYDVHPQVELTAGKKPPEGQPGLIIGEYLVGKYEGFEIGGTVRVGKERWPVLGTFRAPGTVFGSELWCDRRALYDALKLHQASYLTARLASPAAFAELEREVSQYRTEKLKVLTEPQVYQLTFAKATVYVRTVEIVVLVLILGIIFATTNSMYAAFLERLTEIGTLMAIGYTRSRLALLLLLESLLMALAFGVLGVAIAFTVHGHTMVSRATGLAFTIHLDPGVIAVGVGVAGVVGLLGAIVGAIQILRLNALDALRQG